MSPPTGTAVRGRPAIDPRIRQRRLAIRRSKGRRRLRWISGAVGAVAVAVAGVALLHSPWMSARVVSISGVHPHTSDASIVAAAGLDHHPPLISVDPGATAQRVETLPFISAAQVHRHWPDGVTISVSERVPAVTMAGPAASWSVLDGDGRTLEVQPARPPGLVVLVVHTNTGALPPSPVGGALGPGGSFGVAVCRTLPPAFSAQVTSVIVAPDATVSMVLNSGITVLLGNDDHLAAKYEDVAAIIAHGSLHGATTVDVTVPQSPAVTG